MRFRPLKRIAETPEGSANIIHYEISNDSFQWRWFFLSPLPRFALSISTQPRRYGECSGYAHGILRSTVKLGPKHCQMCNQTCPNDAHMEKCSVCKVARYCSRSHNIQVWQQGRLCHKMMCPLLKRWRRSVLHGRPKVNLNKLNAVAWL